MTPQHSFLLHEFGTLAIAGAVQHVSIYDDRATEADREEFRDSLRNQLDKFSVEYLSEVSEPRHQENIVKLTERLTRRHSGVLQRNVFRVGPAQKALNLYLKYLWCVGSIPRPPHCPVDAIVLRAAGVGPQVSWSKIESIEEYAQLIAKLKSVARGEPLAEWELRVWSRG